MRRIADLYPGEAKTDARDACPLELIESPERIPARLFRPARGRLDCSEVPKDDGQLLLLTRFQGRQNPQQSVARLRHVPGLQLRVALESRQPDRAEPVQPLRALVPRASGQHVFGVPDQMERGARVAAPGFTLRLNRIQPRQQLGGRRTAPRIGTRSHHALDSIVTTPFPTGHERRVGEDCRTQQGVIGLAGGLQRAQQGLSCTIGLTHVKELNAPGEQVEPFRVR
jgi:hypothetical protein